MILVNISCEIVSLYYDKNGISNGMTQAFQTIEVSGKTEYPTATFLCACGLLIQITDGIKIHFLKGTEDIFNIIVQVIKIFSWKR